MWWGGVRKAGAGVGVVWSVVGWGGWDRVGLGGGADLQVGGAMQRGGVVWMDAAMQSGVGWMRPFAAICGYSLSKNIKQKN